MEHLGKGVVIRYKLPKKVAVIFQGSAFYQFYAVVQSRKRLEGAFAHLRSKLRVPLGDSCRTANLAQHIRQGKQRTRSYLPPLYRMLSWWECSACEGAR